MSGDKKEFYSIDEVKHRIRAYFQFIIKKWVLFSIAAFLGGGLGILIYKNKKPKYEAVGTFILEDKSSGGGGLAGLASQFGLNLGGIGGSSMFSADNILNILKSKKVVLEVLLSYADSSQSNRKRLADYYLEFTGKKEKWKKYPHLANISFTSVEANRSILQDSVLNEIYDAVITKNIFTERISKQGSIFKVQVISESNTFSRLVAERLITGASELYRGIKTSTAEANVKEMQRRADSLLMLLNRQSYTAASSQPLDINPGLRTYVVPAEIATRDKTVLATLYAEVTKNLEASKLILSQQTPIIQILDMPSLALEDKSKGFVVTILLTMMVAIILTAAGFSILYFLRIYRK